MSVRSTKTTHAKSVRKKAAPKPKAVHVKLAHHAAAHTTKSEHVKAHVKPKVRKIKRVSYTGHRRGTGPSGTQRG